MNALFYKQTCPYPGRLAYIHAHPFIIVGIDTIACDVGGHRGTGGGDGEDQGYIVGEGEYQSEYETLCAGHWGAGRCM